MSETMRTLSFEILKAKYDLKVLSNVEIHKAYREIYAELQQAERDYAKENPSVKILK